MSEMTVSQALRRLKKVKGELAEQLKRADDALTHKTEEEPAFSFGGAMEKSDELRKEIVELKARIAHTNAATMVSFGPDASISMAVAVLMLSEMKAQIKWLGGLVRTRNQRITTQLESEWDDALGKTVSRKVPIMCHLTESERAQKISNEQEKFDRLNDAVETSNHRTVLKPFNQGGKREE